MNGALTLIGFAILFAASSSAPLSPSPSPASDAGTFSTGAGFVVAAILIGLLLWYRARLARR